MATFNEVSEIMVYLTALFPNFQCAKETIGAYYDLLRDIDSEMLLQAARQIGSENTFFPSVSEIRKTALALTARAEGVPSSAEAWGEVISEVHRVGTYVGPMWNRELEFSNPLILRAVQALGWQNICLSETPGVERAHFFKIYDQLLERHRCDAKMLPEVRDMVMFLAEKMRMPALTDGNR